MALAWLPKESRMDFWLTCEIALGIVLANVIERVLKHLVG